MSPENAESCAQLRLMDGESAKRTWDLSRAAAPFTLTVGASEQCSWVVRDVGVAPLHVSFHWDGSLLRVADTHGAGDVRIDGTPATRQWRSISGRVRVEFGRAAIVVDTSPQHASSSVGPSTLPRTGVSVMRVVSAGTEARAAQVAPVRAVFNSAPAYVDEARGRSTLPEIPPVQLATNPPVQVAPAPVEPPRRADWQARADVPRAPAPVNPGWQPPAQQARPEVVAVRTIESSPAAAGPAYPLALRGVPTRAAEEPFAEQTTRAYEEPRTNGNTREPSGRVPTQASPQHRFIIPGIVPSVDGSGQAPADVTSGPTPEVVAVPRSAAPTASKPPRAPRSRMWSAVALVALTAVACAAWFAFKRG